METKIFSIDSRFRNKTAYPNSHNFTYTIEETVDNVNHIEQFEEKNIIEINILSMELQNTSNFINSSRVNNTFVEGSTTLNINDGSYTKNELITELNRVIELDGTPDTGDNIFSYSSTTGKVTINNTTSNAIKFENNSTNYDALGSILGFSSLTKTISANTSATAENAMTLPQEKYFFLKVNDIGNIINRKTNKRYLAKIVLDNSSRFEATNIETQFNIISKPHKLNQPIDINNLEISLEDDLGNLVDLNGTDFSITLELSIISNSILKKYNEVSFYDNKLMESILHSKMLEYYEKEASKKTNDSLTNNYNSNLINYNNVQEYNHQGNRNDYN